MVINVIDEVVVNYGLLYLYKSLVCLLIFNHFCSERDLYCWVVLLCLVHLLLYALSRVQVLFDFISSSNSAPQFGSAIPRYLNSLRLFCTLTRHFEMLPRCSSLTQHLASCLSVMMLA